MKNLLRQELLQKRKAPTEEEKKAKSQEIVKKLFSLPAYKKSKNIMFYVSLKNEVQTGEMIKEALKQKKNVLIPQTDLKKKSMTAVQIKEKTKFKQNAKLKVMEPMQGSAVEKEVIDLIIIPAVGFDFWGHRIGLGGGYYDRFLKGTKAAKIGLAYDFQIINEIPADENDVKVDTVITEKRIIRYNDGSD